MIVNQIRFCRSVAFANAAKLTLAASCSAAEAIWARYSESIPARPENSPSGERTLGRRFVRRRRIEQRHLTARLLHRGDGRGRGAGNGDVHFGFQLSARKK